MERKGVTLIELVVSMGLFAIIATLTISAYVTISNMKALTSATRESQQKLRIATETISRLSKQADVVTLDTTGHDLRLYFNTKTTTPTGVRFYIDTATETIMYYNRCETAIQPNDISCSLWTEDTDMFTGSVRVRPTTAFSRINDRGLPTLNLQIYGYFPFVADKPYYKRDFELTTTTILEGLK